MIQSTMLRMVLRATVLVAVFVVATGTSAEEPKDILFYGNSFTNAVGAGSSRSVPDRVERHCRRRRASGPSQPQCVGQ